MEYIIRLIKILSISLIAMGSIAQAEEKSLYERLGGKQAITAVVSQFVDFNNADKVIASRWDPENVDNLKLYLTELVCKASGGPCIYTGQHIDVAHAGLNVTNEEFDRVAANLARALDKFNVPVKEKGELLTIVGSLRGEVVGK